MQYIIQILNKTLWQVNNRWQIIGAAVGTFIGLLLLLLSLQFYCDLKELMDGGNSDDRFVIINKKVNLFNTLGAKAAFSEEEVQTLLAEDFIDSVGTFQSNLFRVSASSQMLGFYTELFFESLPDRYLDVQDSRWNWRPGQKDVPLIMSRDYLALYNFGFAPSQGLTTIHPANDQAGDNGSDGTRQWVAAKVYWPHCRF